MNTKSQDDNRIEPKENESMNENSFSVCLHSAKFKLFSVSRKGEQQSGLKKDEQHHSDYNWCPIRHFVKNKVDLLSFR